MAALAEDKQVRVRNPQAGFEYSVPVEESTKIYKGAIVCTNAAGYAVAGADTAALQFVGIAQEQADNSSGADGAITVNVLSKTLFEMTVTSAALANVNDAVQITDSQTLALTGTSNAVQVGFIAEFISSGLAWVYLTPIHYIDTDT